MTVQLEDGYMTITAAKSLDKDEKDEAGKYIRQERYSGTCSRSFYVGPAITVEDIKAKAEATAKAAAETVKEAVGGNQ